METRGPAPTAVADPDLAQLAQGHGPFLTVYLTTEAEVENAAQRSEQRWKTLRQTLRDDGAPEELLAKVDPLVGDAHKRGECLAVVVGEGDGEVHAEYEPEPPTADVGRWGPFPALAPLVEWRQSTVPHVVVLADRTGADILAFARGRPDMVAEVKGDPDAPVHKAKPGGWSQARYQRRAENAWEQNARDVAGAVADLVERIHGRLVVLAGDVRAVTMIKDDLPGEVAELVHVVEGGRAPDGSVDEIAEQTSRLVATVVASDTRAVLEKFREERGQHDRAADGPDATITALNESRVDVLLVPGDVDSDETVWGSATQPVPLSREPDTLRSLGVDDPVAGPLNDALIRAALGTGARVRIVPKAAAPEQGIGAILRW